ncbi:MAG TPA: ubiquinone/menaquinone biosynthesis methyltransferase [Bryobacteraceae bacterium]|nr:ubiquinone/menaquinone biosynthesis methyltransferase [Bryobacteraceae bacterium]
MQHVAILGRGAGRQVCHAGGLADRIRRQDCRRGGQDCPLHGSGCGCAAVWGCDFSGPMLDIARRKISAPVLIEADALHLPMPDGSLDLITIAFGFRNLTSYRAGLQEMARVLRPGGVAAILEFSQPRGRVFPALYGFYSRHVLPLVGGILSGSRDAYAYLPESVRRFPGAEDLAAEMRAAGFGEVTYERMTAGVVALHLGTR